jgi:hypothetical protein
VPAFADEIHDGPVVFSLLQALQSQMNEFRAAETASQEDSEDGAVAFTARSLQCWGLHQGAPLFRCQPVADSHTELFNALNPFHSGRELGAQ